MILLSVRVCRIWFRLEVYVMEAWPDGKEGRWQLRLRLSRLAHQDCESCLFTLGSLSHVVQVCFVTRTKGPSVATSIPDTASGTECHNRLQVSAGVTVTWEGCVPQVIRAMFALATTEAATQSEALRATQFRSEAILNRGSHIRLWKKWRLEYAWQKIRASLW